MQTAINYTIYRPMNPENLDLLATGHVEVDNDGATTLTPELQHLACFAGGMFALGGKLFDTPSHVDIGHKLTQTCIWAYHSTPSGIMPEVSKLYGCHLSTPSSFDDPCPWNKTRWQSEIAALASVTHLPPHPHLPPGFTEMTDRRYLLRPEAIESVFILYRITGDPTYREAAWNMWTAIVSATETPLAHSAMWDVLLRPTTAELKMKNKQDAMESFWMAETLKYFWLVFADEKVLGLDEWVFNTEAHPFRIPRP